jgi:SAM-dependent methyltransferase
VDPSTYGDRIADVYDAWYAGATDVEGTVATIKRLVGAASASVANGQPASVANGQHAHDRSVLELGIGTGRLAIPMVDAGLDVHGIDASPAMVAALRSKPGGDAIPVTIGDFADVPVDGRFGVVLLAFNALLNLTSAEAQTACLRAAAEHLVPGGHVVVETFVPGDAAPREAVEVRHVDADEVRLSAYRIDDHVVSGSIVSITETGIKLRPWSVRLSSPAEIDAAAAAAGLAVADRWSGWRGERFDDTSERAVTVYRRGGV